MTKDSPPQSNTASTASNPGAQPFDIEIVKKNLKSGIKTSVGAVNSALGKFESEKNYVTLGFTSRVGPLFRKILNRAQGFSMDEIRSMYGTQLVAGSTAVGGLYGLARRGRVGGLFIGSIAGLSAYAGLYELPLSKNEDQESTESS